MSSRSLRRRFNHCTFLRVKIYKTTIRGRWLLNLNFCRTHRTTSVNWLTSGKLISINIDQDGSAVGTAAEDPVNAKGLDFIFDWYA
jgi:hypothetical protein